MNRLPHHGLRFALAALLLALAGVFPVMPVAAKEGWAPAWIASGSQPLPTGCAPTEPMFALAQLFQQYNDGIVAELRMYAMLGGDQHPIVVPGHLNHVAVMNDADQLADFAETRHAQHDRFVLLQIVVNQGDHAWLDVTFDAFREADDFPGRVVGGTAQFDCRAKWLLGLQIGNQELIAALQPPAIRVPDAPLAADCTAAPVAAGKLPDLTRAVTTAKWLWATTYGPSPAETRLVPDDYPVIPGMIATTQELLACVRAHDFGRAAALFTPDYFAHAPAAVEMPDLAIPHLLMALADPTSSAQVALEPALQDMGDVQLLPDGRVAAWLTISGTAMATHQEVIFARSGNRWLIARAYLNR